ncbi:hypothetical protein ACGFZ9_40340 [Streptomyces mirabilis]|uniref:hypothetical protein n=1 Tax=Streptomyces mirabilis TaxID=68239 RepID=UPI00371FB8E2
MTTEAAAGTVDLTVMYAAHDAFRRDLERLGDAAAEGTAFTPQVRAGWDNFRHQLHIHHTPRTAICGRAWSARSRAVPGTSPSSPRWRRSTPSSTRGSPPSTRP